MLHSLRAIVLRATKYRDTSLVVKVYTNLFGVRTYMVKGVRKPGKGGLSVAMFQPMGILDMQVYERPNRDIQHIKEVRAAYHYTSIPFTVEKSGLAIFINELLNKSIKEESANEFLFNFLYESLCYLDDSRDSLALFHLRFMLRLSRFLGFYPDNNFHPQKRPYFNMIEGVFELKLPIEKYAIEPPLSVYFSQLLAGNEEISITKQHRQALLQKCIDFYSCQLPQFGEMKSVEVLREVFAE